MFLNARFPTTQVKSYNTYAYAIISSSYCILYCVFRLHSLIVPAFNFKNGNGNGEISCTGNVQHSLTEMLMLQLVKYDKIFSETVITFSNNNNSAILLNIFSYTADTDYIIIFSVIYL